MRACAWTRHGMSAVVKAQLCGADILLPPYLGPGAETSPGEQGMKITFSILAPKGPLHGIIYCCSLVITAPLTGTTLAA